MHKVFSMTRVKVEEQHNDLSRDVRFPTMWHFTGIDSDQHVQSPLKIRNFQ